MNIQHPTDTLVTIEDLSHEARGIAHIHGKTIFVWGALPGEELKIKITRRHGSYDEADATEIIKASPERMVALCPHFGVCGGCSLQHIKAEAQVQYKEQAFLELLAHQANAKPNTRLAALTGKSWGYRTKARIGVKYVAKKNKVLVGFRERKGRYIADLSVCKVLDLKVGNLIDAFSSLIDSLSIRDQIAQLEVAVTEDVTAVIIRHLSAFNLEDLNLLQSFAKKHKLQFYFQPKGIDSIHLFYPKEAKELLSYSLAAYQLTLEFHPAQFTQVNTEINEQMIDQALKLLDLKPEDQVLDLFCGIGNFSLPLAQQVKSVVGVEGDASAVKQAEANAQLNQIENTGFYVANLFEDISDTAWAKQDFNKILLDPPRAGAQELMPQLAKWKAERIVYISCNPATLARDTKLLLAEGYELEAAGVMDMFPHTQHVEAMALFTRK